MEKFNSDNTKIDAALKDLAKKVASHTAKLENVGNTQIYTTSYTGTGKSTNSNPCRLTFTKAPFLVLIFGNKDTGFTTQGAPFLKNCRTGGNVSNTATWTADGKTVTWYTNNNEDQMNRDGYVYQVIYFCQA